MSRPQAGTDYYPPWPHPYPPWPHPDPPWPHPSASWPYPDPAPLAAAPPPGRPSAPSGLPSARLPSGEPARRLPPRPAGDAGFAGHIAGVAVASRVFAAQPVQIGHARRFIAGVLSGLRAADDIVLCVCELASNAVLHSCSREPGGQFTVRVAVSACGRVRAEVADRGGPWQRGPAADEERGRGLLIVAALATRWGISGSATGRSAWLELDPPRAAAIP